MLPQLNLLDVDLRDGVLEASAIDAAVKVPTRRGGSDPVARRESPPGCHLVGHRGQRVGGTRVFGEHADPRTRRASDHWVCRTLNPIGRACHAKFRCRRGILDCNSAR